MSEPDLGPSTEDVVPDDAGDAYVAHSTPELGTERNRRLLLYAVIPIVALVLAILIWILVAQ